LGNNAGSTGSVTVTGVGSTWNNSYDLYVGKSGNGSLTVSNGGLVTAKTLYASLGDLFGDGAITTKGALLDADLVFDSSQGAQPTIHFGTNGSLNLNVDGSAAMGVGYKANGTLRIADGLTVISSIAYLGYNESSVGLATVSGKGSRWTNNSYFYVGSSGMGILNVKEGGQVTSNTYTTYVGYNPTSNGTIAVNGIGSVWTNNNLVVGYYGNGTLNIEAGGQVISNYNSVGTQPGAVGTVTVTGAGSKWINNFTNDLQVGVSGSGTLNIESGGLVMTLSMILANSAKSSGMCNISDGGVLQTATLRQGNGIASVNWNDGVIQNYNPNTNLAVSSNLTIRLASTGTHAFNVDSGRTGTVDAVLTDATSGGTLKKIGAGTLVLTAANSYSGETEVEYGTLSVRVPYLEDHADIRISSGALLDLNFSGSDTVRSLYLDGLLAEVGTWGSSQSRAAHIDNAHFSGAGMLNVTVPEPSTVALLLAASLGGLLYVRNKSWRTR
jgi:T5SS/PEP-CTERM-associated repeat protein/autotransporter-associated beta strand protein